MQWKYALTRLGGHVSSTFIRRANSVVNALTLGKWLRANGYSVQHRLPQRENLYELIATEVALRKVLYMEFGVWRGASMRYWSNLLLNPESQLHGFDSFEGLPETWAPDQPKGHFSTNGHMPTFSDSRVRLFKGWFEDTLPGYTLPPHDVLIIHLDADLYSSTIYVLDTLKDVIVPGTYLLFDEFSDRLHEFRAFDEFLRSTKASFSLAGVTSNLAQFAFKRI